MVDGVGSFDVTLSEERFFSRRPSRTSERGDPSADNELRLCCAFVAALCTLSQANAALQQPWHTATVDYSAANEYVSAHYPLLNGDGYFAKRLAIRLLVAQPIFSAGKAFRRCVRQASSGVVGYLRLWSVVAVRIGERV